MTTKNEFELLESIVNHLHYVRQTQAYIKENFGLDSEYDEENVVLHIKSNSLNESLQLASAKQYVNENLGCVDVVYDFE